MNAQIHCKNSNRKAESSTSAITPTMTQTREDSSLAC